MSSDKSENLSDSPRACGKVCTALFCCSCQTDDDLSLHQQGRMPSFTAPDISQPTHDHSAKASGVQTKSRRAEAAENKVVLPSKGAAEKGGHGQAHAENEGKKSSSAKHDMFSDYINRARVKIRTMSSFGSGKTSSEPVDVHDAKEDNSGKDSFTDYINRAKMKIRKTSSLGSGKSYSLKLE